MPHLGDNEWTVARREFLGLSVDPITHRRYLKNVRKFCEWLREVRWEVYNGSIDAVEDMDKALADYVRFQFFANSKCGNMQDCVYARVGMETYAGWTNFPLAKRALAAWDRQVQSVPHVPIPWSLLRLVATVLRLQYGSWLYHLLILGFRLMLRPGELLCLVWDDLSLPSAHSRHCGGVNIRNAKTRRIMRHQFVVARDPFALEAIAWFHEHGAPGELLAQGLTSRDFIAVFRWALTVLGVDHLPFTPYSMRHGGAVDAFLSGREVRLIQEDGRWTASRTMKRYLQVRMALMMQHKLPRLVGVLFDALCAED